MPTTTALTTELEAINTMLDAIGESPVSSLEVSGLVDVAKAKATLNEISREVQDRGWTFNSESQYPLTPSSSGFINLPPNFLKVDSSATESLNVVQRGVKLYDKANHTYIFANSLKADVVLLLPWDELPQVARHYIMIKASRVFQTRQLGSDSQHKFSDNQEFEAFALMNEAESAAGDYNMLSGSYSVSQILER